MKYRFNVLNAAYPKHCFIATQISTFPIAILKYSLRVAGALLSIIVTNIIRRSAKVPPLPVIWLYGGFIYDLEKNN